LSHGTLRPSSTPRLLVAAALAASLAACGSDSASGAELQQGARRTEAPRVIAAEVERRDVVRYLETTTRIESEREITIHPEVAGFVTAVEAEEGDSVAEGDVLCELDAIDEELNVRDAEVALQEAQEAERQPVLDRAEATARAESARLAYEQKQRDYERDQRLFENKEVASPVSRQTLEASRLAMETAASELEQAKIALDQADLAAQKTSTAVARAEVALSQAERALAQRTIRAPFPGQIATRSVRLGQSVGPADAIFVLTDVDHVRAVFYRAQEELALFRGTSDAPDGTDGPDGVGDSEPALAFEARTEALPGATFTGRVRRISPTIDRDSGQFRVTGEFDPPADGALALLPGMLVRLSIATDRHEDALCVPKRAVRREGDFTYVLRIGDDRTVTRVLVEEGYEDGDLVEIVLDGESALAAGDLVVSVGSRDLEDGDAVRVEGDEDAGDEDAGDEATGDEATGETAGDEEPGDEALAADEPDADGSTEAAGDDGSEG